MTVGSLEFTLMCGLISFIFGVGLGYFFGRR